MPYIAITWKKIKPSLLALLRSGVDLKKNTNQTNNISKNKIIKFCLVLILSNIFFFMLFSSDERAPVHGRKIGVEIIIEGKLLTSFEEHKEVLLTHSPSGQKIRATLRSALESQSGTEGTQYLVSSSEEDALKILKYPSGWTILPYLKNYSLHQPKRLIQEIDHEIHF